MGTEYEAKSMEMLGKILDEQQATKADFREAMAQHEAKDDERFEKLSVDAYEQKTAVLALRQLLGSQRPPSLTDVGATAKEVVAQHDKDVKAARWDAIVKNAGKIAVALLVLMIAFAGGSFWRDLTARGSSTTNTITTIAPGTAAK